MLHLIGLLGLVPLFFLSFLTNRNFDAWLRIDKHDISQHSNTDVDAVVHQVGLGVFTRVFLPSGVRTVFLDMFTLSFDVFMLVFYDANLDVFMLVFWTYT